MTAEADYISALRAYLLGNTEVSALTGTRIYVGEIPQSEMENQTDIEAPSKILVIKIAGGRGREDRIRIENGAVDILCYGETFHEADLLRRTVADVLKNIVRVVQDNVLLHNLGSAGGPLTLKDPDSKWPVMFQSFRMLAATQSTA